MVLTQISTHRYGRWLAALLLLLPLPARHALSLSDGTLKDVDYPVLPLSGPLLTVRSSIEACCHPQTPK